MLEEMATTEEGAETAVIAGRIFGDSPGHDPRTMTELGGIMPPSSRWWLRTTAWVNLQPHVEDHNDIRRWHADERDAHPGTQVLYTDPHECNGVYRH